MGGLPPTASANMPATFTPRSTTVMTPYAASPLTIPTCTSQGTIETRSITSAIAGYNIPVQIYLPPCYGEDGRNYPVIYLFHGGSYDYTHWTNLGVVETADSGISSDILPPIVMVMPGGGLLADTTSGGSFSYEGFVLDELIPFVENNYCASPNGKNRAIGGISRGGYWALEIAFRFPDTFASAGGHSAALLDSFAGPDLNPRYTGLANDLSGLRIYLDIGESDWVITEISLLHDEMEAAGIKHTWLLNPGGHDDEYWASHVFEYLEWYTRIWHKDRFEFSECLVSVPD